MSNNGKMGRVFVKSGSIDMSQNGKPVTLQELKNRAKANSGFRQPRKEDVFDMSGDEPDKNVKVAGNIAAEYLKKKSGAGYDESVLSRFPPVNSPAEVAPKEEPVKVNPMPRPEPKVNKADPFYLGEDIDLDERHSPPSELGPNAQKITLLSRGLYSPFKNVYARPLNFPEFCYLQSAIASKQEGMILDVLDKTVSIDIRSLVYKDFTYYLYWLRLNSLPSTPMSFDWVSIYGNSNVFTLRDLTLQAEVTEKTEEDLKDFPEFSFPTVGDREAFKSAIDSMKQAGKDTVAFTALVKQAQYLKGDSLKEKIELAKITPPDIMFSKLNKFKKTFSDFGMKEEFVARDSKFNAEEALETLILKAEVIAEHIKENKDQDTYRARDIAELVDNEEVIIKEIARIKKSISDTGEAAPMSETRTFSFSMADFFPEV